MGFNSLEEVIGFDGKIDPKLRAEYMYGIRPPVQTWPDGARRAVYSVIDHSFKWNDRLEDVRDTLEYMINLNEEKPDIDNSVWAEQWAILGSIAAAVGKKLNFFEVDLDNVEYYVNRISSILVSKQLDYGSENISKFGRTGILVRVHDKVARLENLILKNIQNPNNESILDNLLDLIGYAAIGIMWERDWFLLPIED